MNKGEHRKTLLELLDVDRAKCKELDDKITALLMEHIEPGAESVVAMLAVASRAAAANAMPFVLAVSVMEWLYNDQAKKLSGIPPKPSDPSMH